VQIDYLVGVVGVTTNYIRISANLFYVVNL
jgi:hypothetical protein